MPTSVERANKIAEFVQPNLEPGEHVELVLHSAYPGATGWHLLGPAYQFAIGMRAIVLTEKHAMLLKCTTPGSTPRSIVKTVPRDHVHVAEYRKKGRIVLDIDGEKKNFVVLMRVAGHENDFAKALGHPGRN
jgi:hypothetical protein